jgi:hypothetical protein
MWRRRFALFVLVLVASAPAESSVAPVGARAGALGGAFTAVADDPTAFYWNPAGLVHGPFLRLGFFGGEAFEDRGEWVTSLRARRAEAPGALSSDRAVGFSAALTVLGLSIYRFRHTDQTLEAGRLKARALETLEIGATFVQSLPLNDLTLGVNLRYVAGASFESAREAAAIPDAERNVGDLIRIATDTPGRREAEAAVDLGVMYQPRPELRLGLSVRNLNRPTFHFESDETIQLERQARLGVAVFAPGHLLLAMDVDLTARPDDRPGGGVREVAFGVERPWGGEEARLRLRGGLRAELADGRLERPAVSAGFGLRLADFELSLAAAAASGRRKAGLWAGVTYRP